MLLFGGIAIGIILLPFLSVSNPMMGYYHSRIDKNPTTDFNKWLHLWTAGVCYKTMRPEKAADYYYKYLERFPEDPQRPFLMFRYASSLDDANRNADAIKAYQVFMEEYPEDPNRQSADNSVTRIRYQKPNK